MLFEFDSKEEKLVLSEMNLAHKNYPGSEVSDKTKF